MTIDIDPMTENLELVRLVASQYDPDDDGSFQAPRIREQDGPAEAPRRDLLAEQDGTLDGVQAYLNEIGRVPLLTAPEEVELAQQIIRGDAAKERLATGDDLTPL